MKCPILAVPLLLLLSLPAWADEPGATLDAFHRAAAEADLQAYLGLMTEDVVFLGTDGTERWEGQAFYDFVRGHFQAGRGWTYRPSGRTVRLGENGQVAWFDESLENAALGACRGSGVLVLQEGRWKVAQYNLSVPVPNELILSVVAQIRSAQGGAMPVDDSNGSSPVSASPSAEAAQQQPETPCRKKRHKTNRAASC